MQICEAQPAHLEGILAIYNHAVAHTTAIWNDTLVDLPNRAAWLAERQRQSYPVLVALDDDGCVAGYASFGDWRAWDGYRHTVEHSVYVHPDHRRRGIARALMQALMPRAAGLGKHVMVAGIESGNTASIALHRELGFEPAGHLREVGTKFGRWLDLSFMQRMLTP